MAVDAKQVQADVAKLNRAIKRLQAIEKRALEFVEAEERYLRSSDRWKRSPPSTRKLRHALKYGV